MKLVSVSLVVVGSAALIQNAGAQCRIAGNPESGLAALDRGRAIVGVGGYPGGIPVVRFYQKTAQGWTQEQQAVVGDLTAVYPPAVAIDGDRCLVGSAETNFLVGRASVFDRVGSSWIPTEILPTTSGYATLFGSVVALDGDIAVVGAEHSMMDGGDGLARAHVFEFGGTGWTETAQLTNYGGAIDLDDQTIVLGNDDTFPGHVDVYERIGALWLWTDRIAVGTPPQGPYLGSAVALEGDTLVAGARGNYSSGGRVEVFHRQGTAWVPIQTIVPSDSSAGDDFGYSVALSGGTLLVGAPGGSGRVYRYDHDGTSFVESGSFGAEGSSQSFGFAVAVQREDAIVSAFQSVGVYRLGFAHAASFCTTTPNSTGSPGSLAVEGCDSASGQRLTLVASALPPGVLARAFFGAATTRVPFGDGFLCIGAPLFRLPAGAADAAGRFVHDVDFASTPAGHLVAGSTWHFQVFHRDPGAGAGLNLTNAFSIGITP